MGVNSLPKTVTRQRHGCDLNPGLLRLKFQHANHSATEPPSEGEGRGKGRGITTGFSLLKVNFLVTSLRDRETDGLPHRLMLPTMGRAH